MAGALDAEDVLQITNLIHRFVQALDSGDTAAFAALFARTGGGGTLTVVKPGITRRGRAELEALCAGLHAKFSSCQHWEGNVLIEAASASASASSSSSGGVVEGGGGGQQGVVSRAVGRAVGRATTATNRSYWQALDGGERISMGIHDDVFTYEEDDDGDDGGDDGEHDGKGTRCTVSGGGNGGDGGGRRRGKWVFLRRVVVHTWTKAGGFEVDPTTSRGEGKGRTFRKEDVATTAAPAALAAPAFTASTASTASTAATAPHCPAKL